MTLKVERDQTNAAIKQQLSAGGPLQGGPLQGGPLQGGPLLGADQQLQPKVVQVNQPVSPTLLFSFHLIFLSGPHNIVNAFEFLPSTYPTSAISIIVAMAKSNKTRRKRAYLFNELRTMKRLNEIVFLFA